MRLGRGGGGVCAAAGTRELATNASAAAREVRAMSMLPKVLTIDPSSRHASSKSVLGFHPISALSPQPRPYRNTRVMERNSLAIQDSSSRRKGAPVTRLLDLL